MADAGNEARCSKCGAAFPAEFLKCLPPRQDGRTFCPTCALPGLRPRGVFAPRATGRCSKCGKSLIRGDADLCLDCYLASPSQRKEGHVLDFPAPPSGKEDQHELRSRVQEEPPDCRLDDDSPKCLSCGRPTGYSWTAFGTRMSGGGRGMQGCPSCQTLREMTASVRERRRQRFRVLAKWVALGGGLLLAAVAVTIWLAIR
jgi:hypothetical protein